MPECIVFSDRAAISLLVEAREQKVNETGGVFLGYRRGRIWYVIECCDPGPMAIFKPAYFEYDHKYINHLINKLSRIYSQQLELLGLWHRHPGSFDSFSVTDDITNSEYAKLHPQGAISAIANIDPDFRLTLYEVTWPLRYRRVRHLIGDARIPASLLSFVSRRGVLEELSEASSGANRPVISPSSRSSSPSVAQQPVVSKRPTTAARFSLSAALRFYLLQHQDQGQYLAMDEISVGAPDAVEQLLEQLQSDIDYLDQIGVQMKMRIDGRDLLEMREISPNGGSTGLLLGYGLAGRETRFVWQGQSYAYSPGMLQRACELFSGYGGVF